MRYMSLFCGVGMFDYAFTRLGWTPVVASDCDEYCKRVYLHHYPDAVWFDDVRDITYDRLKEAGIVSDTEDTDEKQTSKSPIGRASVQHRGSGGRDGIPGTSGEPTNQPTGIDVICGGFPCQDLSVAGKQAGITAERSGLWGEFARIISEIRPRYVIVENVSALLTGDNGAWMRRVLGDIAEIGGYEVEWHVIPAGGTEVSAGAPHRRDRVWIICTNVAHASRLDADREAGGVCKEERGSGGALHPESCGTGAAYCGESSNVGDTKHDGHPDMRIQENVAGDYGRTQTEVAQPTRASNDVADSKRTGLEGLTGDGVHRNKPGRDDQGQDGFAASQGVQPSPRWAERKPGESMGQPADGSTAGLLGHRIAHHLVNAPLCRKCGNPEGHDGPCRNCWADGSWEHGVPRVATGEKERVNRLKALGNGLVWYVPLAIGMALEEQQEQI